MRTVLADIKQALIELELISHASTANLNKTGSRSSEHPSRILGYGSPGSNVERLDSDLTTDERLSFESSYLSKTVEHYKRRLEGWSSWNQRREERLYFHGLLNDPRLSEDERAAKLAELLTDIRETTRCWRFTPEPQGRGLVPERGTFYWKCMVADDDKGTLKQIHQRHQISRMTLWRYRQRYRGLLSERGSVRM